MILSWIPLLLLQQGYALVPVTKVQLGESVTFTCSFSDLDYSSTRVKWYKQNSGDTLKLITSLMKVTEKPTFEQGFPSSRFHATVTTTMSTLTIRKTIQEDEAIYHCGVTAWSTDQWSGTYLSLKGNIQRTDYTVVQWPTASGPVRPGDSVTLQCSVLSDSEKKSCPGVQWFENVSSSDARTYCCAVARCGEIISGNGTQVDVEGTSRWTFDVVRVNYIILILSGAVMAISLIVIAFLIDTIKKNKCGHCSKRADVSLHVHLAKRHLKGDEDRWIYSSVVFTMMKAGSGRTVDTRAVRMQREDQC